MLSGVSADQTMHVLKGVTASCRGRLAVYPDFQMTVPEIIIVSALLLNPRHVGL